MICALALRNAQLIVPEPTAGFVCRLIRTKSKIGTERSSLGELESEREYPVEVEPRMSRMRLYRRHDQGRARVRYPERRSSEETKRGCPTGHAQDITDERGLDAGRGLAIIAVEPRSK